MYCKTLLEDKSISRHQKVCKQNPESIKGEIIRKARQNCSDVAENKPQNKSQEEKDSTKKSKYSHSKSGGWNRGMCSKLLEFVSVYSIFCTVDK